MPFNEPTVRASVFAALPTYLSTRGVDVSPLLEEAGLDNRAVADNTLIISLNSAAALFERAARRLNDPTFGLSYAAAFPIGASGLLGHLIMSAPTVRDVIIVLTKYLEIHTTQLQQTFEEDEGIGRLSFIWPTSATAPHVQYTAFSMGVLILRLRLALSPTWCPLTTGFQHRAPLPQYLPDYQKLFGSRLKFDQPYNEIAIDAASLSRAMPKVMQGLFETIRELGEQKLQAAAAPDDVASELHTLLAKRLAAEEPFSLESVAEALQLQVRALQWRLEQEATTYEKVLLLTRVIAAESYLRDSDHNLTRIASLLGFSELSVLTRWSQHQFHMTPSAYRKKLRAPKAFEPETT